MQPHGNVGVSNTQLQKLSAGNINDGAIAAVLNIDTTWNTVNGSVSFLPYENSQVLHIPIANNKQYKNKNWWSYQAKKLATIWKKKSYSNWCHDQWTLTSPLSHKTLLQSQPKLEQLHQGLIYVNIPLGYHNFMTNCGQEYTFSQASHVNQTLQGIAMNIAHHVRQQFLEN